MSANNSTQPVARLKRRILLRRPGVERKSSASIEDDSFKCKEGTSVALYSSDTTNETTVYTKDTQDSLSHGLNITQLRKRSKSAYGRPETHASHQYTDERNVVCQNDRKEAPTLCEKTSQLRQRPKSSYGRPTSQVSLQSTGVTNQEMVVQPNDIKDSPSTRPKTPRYRQRIKTYLERWKEAQFESRPCTAIGLMELERKQRDFMFSKETKSRNEAPTQITSDKTRSNNGYASAPDPAELLRKMKSLKQALESAKLNRQHVIKSPSAEVLLSRANTPSTIKGQRERLENLIRNSKVCVTERSQTSLGSMTSNTDQLVNSSSNNKTTRDHNEVSRKSVAFETRPITPWVIARDRERPRTPGNMHRAQERPCTPGNMLRAEERPCPPGNMLRAEERPRTPGIHLTGYITSAINDSVGQISDVMDARQKQNKESKEIVQSAHYDYGRSPCDTQISKRRNVSNSTPVRRIIAARGRYPNTESNSKVELDQGDVPMLRSSKDEWSGKKIETINGYSKTYNTTRNISSNDNGNMLKPKAESIPVQISAGLITDKLKANVLKELPPHLMSVRQGETSVVFIGKRGQHEADLFFTSWDCFWLIVDQLKERYNQTTTLATPTLSQALRCQSTPITLRGKLSTELEGAKEELVNKEDSILSWLEYCEESSLSTHLPVISSTGKASQ